MSLGMKNQSYGLKIDWQKLIDLCGIKYEESIEVSPETEQFKKARYFL